MEVISIKNSEHYIWGNKCDGWHLVQTDALSVIQERMPSNCHEVKHLHKKAEQFFYVLSGMATLEVDNKVYTLEEGQGLHVPAGIPHQLRNESDSDLRFLVTSTPPSHGDRFELGTNK